MTSKNGTFWMEETEFGLPEVLIVSEYVNRPIGFINGKGRFVFYGAVSFSMSDTAALRELVDFIEDLHKKG